MGATAVMGGATLVNGYEQGSALEAQGNYASRVANSNAHMIDLRAEDEINRGNNESQQFRKKIRKLVGAQRAGFGAGGADVNTGSALEVQAQTAEHGAMDALTIKNNAWKQAWGLHQEASNTRFQGEMSKYAGRSAAGRTYATAGLDAFRYAYPELGGRSKSNSYDNKLAGVDENNNFVGVK